MSIVSVDNIQPIGSGTSVTVNSAATLVLNNANSTGVITATTFVGNLTGDLTGSASQITVAANNANTAYRVPFTSSDVGNVSLYSDTTSGMTYNPSTGTLSAEAFSGSGANLTGVANPTLAHAFVFMDSFYFTSTATKMAFNTSTANDQSSGVTIDRTNKRFIPTVGGVYQVVTSLDFDRASGGSNIEYKVMQYKNGSEFARKTSWRATTGINDGLTCLSLMSLNGSGDYVEFYAQHNASGNATMNTRSTFFIIRIA